MQIKNSKKYYNHDYTLEICRCITFICYQVEKGWTLKETINQAIGSYGYAIASNSLEAIKKHFNHYERHHKSS